MAGTMPVGVPTVQYFTKKGDLRRPWAGDVIMSFILDALRKSENSRLRQDHPAVFSHRMTAQRQRLPVWSVVLIALLAMNLLIVAFLLLKNPSTEAEESVEVVASTPSAETPRALGVSTPALPPAPSSAPVATPASPNSIALPQSEGLVTRDDLLARGANLPSVDLNMHVYDANPSMRFVLLNGQRLREGESSREGLLLERITPDGVVLRYGSNTFAVTLQ
jgi:hypothetical protein